MQRFGPKIENGDNIGILLEFTPSGQGELSFFKNGGLIGKAYKEMKEGEYYPCLSINYGRNCVMLNANARMPREPYRRHD